jgi:hypothetical protein
MTLEDYARVLCIPMSSVSILSTHVRYKMYTFVMKLDHKLFYYRQEFLTKQAKIMSR